MGCASSKQPRRCEHCRSPHVPMTRSYSMHVHHPPQGKGDSYHLVSLTSSTLGSLKLDSLNLINGVSGGVGDKPAMFSGNDGGREFSVGLVEAKTWSAMIDEKIPRLGPKTPIRTPPGEPETINAWELMEGLEDISPFRSPIHVRSFSFDVVRDPIPPLAPATDRPKSRLQACDLGSDSPMWLELASDEPEPDPEIVVPSFGKSFEKEKLILYFTSLRGVRKTYEDCCHVRAILKSLGARVDERDMSMHSGFKDELKELLGEKLFTGGLPRLFVGEKYIGGADEIRRLNEEGQIAKLLERCEKTDDPIDGTLKGVECEVCADIRFVPCETCSGSCKIFYEADHEEVENGDAPEEEEEEFGFQRCPDCNENGLIRCPVCCY